MPMPYPGLSHQSLAERLVAGEPAARLSKEMAISEATLYRWKRQLRIDTGLRPGRKSVDDDHVRRLTRRVKTLEHELDLVKTASRPFDELEVNNPKGSSRSSRSSATEASAREACRVTGLGRSTWNYHLRHESSGQSIRRLLLRDLVAGTFVRSRGTYGYRRIRAALALERGLVVNMKLVRRLMGEREISGLSRRRKGHRNPLAAVTSEDLVERHFTADDVNQLWLTDITEHPTRGAKVYCCCVLDMCSRKIVG